MSPSDVAKDQISGESLDNDTKGPPAPGGFDPENEVSGLKLLVLYIGLCLCTFIVGLDFTLIATAVPSITSHFHSVGDVGWYGGAFYLALCASQPLAGKIFTTYPKKPVYLAYVAIFEIGSLVCALAPTSKALIVGRAVAGLGASGIFAGGLIVIITVVPLAKRPIYQGNIGSTFALASVVGPVIGGALTQHLTWRWCFYINLPIGGFAAAVVFFFLDIKEAREPQAQRLQKLKKLDGLGFILFAGSILMLLLALQWGGTTYSWHSSVIIGLFVGSGVVLPLFVMQQIRLGDKALIPPRIFTNRNFPLIGGSAFFSSGAFQTVVYWLPIWFQAVLDVSPTESGVRYLAVVISTVITSFAGPAILHRIGYWNPLLLLGFVLLSIGCGLLTTLMPGISDGHWIGYEILCGVGYALVLTNSQMAVQSSLPPELVPIGATTLLLIQSASSAIWLAVGQAVFQDRLVVRLSQQISSDVARQILATGATQLHSLVTAADLPVVLRIYSKAITNVFFIPTATTPLALLLVCGAKWTTIKKKGNSSSKTKVEQDPENRQVQETKQER